MPREVWYYETLGANGEWNIFEDKLVDLDADPIREFAHGDDIIVRHHGSSHHGGSSRGKKDVIHEEATEPQVEEGIPEVSSPVYDGLVDDISMNGDPVDDIVAHGFMVVTPLVDSSVGDRWVDAPPDIPKETEETL
ncbi:hypothetical protein H6P81_002518 [Aristolochia fimbriata]|uniref:Uncharacterized protein n=1 Tax=Aristolochia fimbriata TaxID=158543 RepID=A0AAV7FA01_ARIFI|nr:hypothetical protein H6P81_002518 [Aristolochia fimbriata]